MEKEDLQFEFDRLHVDVFDETIAARRRIVSDVSFALSAGRGLGITGESGSGKTTLSLALSGLLPAGSRITSQRCHVRIGKTSDGSSVRREPATSHRAVLSPSSFRVPSIFTLFQEPRASLNPYRTIGWQLRRCVRQSSKLAGPLDSPLDPCSAALIEVGLDPTVQTHYPHELSTGMCQRVFLAMASLLGSSILVADEPFASVDSDSQSRLAALVRHWMDTKAITLILVTHDLDLLHKLTDQVLILYRGQVAERGATSEVLAEQPTGHPYTFLLRRSSGTGGAASPILEQLQKSDARTARCCFASRCAWADASICVEETPALRDVTAPGGSRDPLAPVRQVRCVRFPLRGEAWANERNFVSTDNQDRDGAAQILRVENVSREFVTGWLRRSARQVLHDVSFQVHGGERLGIMGPSGHGKTTLARVILGVIAPTMGSVQVAAGHRWLANPARLRAGDRRLFRRHVQMVYQDADLVLDPASRIGDALVEAYRVFNSRIDCTQAYALAGQLLHELGFRDDLLEAYPYRLSGGERKRVALARSLAAFGYPYGALPGDPWRLLILDEPTAGVDVFLQAILGRFLLWIQHRLRLSYLVISHDEEFVRNFCNRALRLSHGRISSDAGHVSINHA